MGNIFSLSEPQKNKLLSHLFGKSSTSTRSIKIDTPIYITPLLSSDISFNYEPTYLYNTPTQLYYNPPQL